MSAASKALAERLASTSAELQRAIEHVAEARRRYVEAEDPTEQRRASHAYRLASVRRDEIARRLVRAQAKEIRK